MWLIKSFGKEIKMKIGEIKAHSIMLTCPEVEISYDCEDEKSLSLAIDNLKCDPNVRDLVLCCVPAINRAFAIIEARGASKKKFVDKRLDKPLSKIAFSDLACDIISVSAIYDSDGRTVSFDKIGDEQICVHTKKAGNYTFVYKSKIPRITDATSDFADVDLCEGVAEIIPYFVKSELVANEDLDASRVAKALFDGILNEYSESHASSQSCVDTIYYFE